MQYHKIFSINIKLWSKYQLIYSFQQFSFRMFSNKSNILENEKIKKLTTLDLRNYCNNGKRIAMITAYDYPSGKHAEIAGFDMILVGDSLGMVVLGYETTTPVTMDDMILHCKAVRRGAPNSFIVGDMPFGSYEVTIDEALRNAYRFIKECGMDAVKVEGGKNRIETIRKLVGGGIPVVGHVGLTPQAVGILGGFRAQGKTANVAISMVKEAIAIQDAGAFCVVIECVPEIVAKTITKILKIPTIGIGAGSFTTGQVLVYHDLLGINNFPKNQKYTPSFCKQYAMIGPIIHDALMSYRQEVSDGIFPSAKYSPYKMKPDEETQFLNILADQESTTEIAKEHKAKNEYDNETVKLY